MQRLNINIEADGEIALFYAGWKKNLLIFELLLKHVANPDACDAVRKDVGYINSRKAFPTLKYDEKRKIFTPKCLK